jgi:acid phosphatase family membrane protein YuiD
VGLYSGFDTPTYALAVALAIVVIYDATGIRRQAGRQAVIINAMINDLASGHPLKTEQLREMLGHTPFQAVIGTILGLAVAQLFRILWK